MPLPDPSHALLSSGEQSLTTVRRVVLDTNAVLDWLLFDDPAMRRLGAAIAAGQVCWVASPAMRGEIEHVLQRGLAGEHGADTADLHATWSRHAVEQADAPPSTLSCTDPDDQKFLDFALAAGATWLVSRDRAVLKLKRRASALGLAILHPRDWRPE